MREQGIPSATAPVEDASAAIVAGVDERSRLVSPIPNTPLMPERTWLRVTGAATVGVALLGFVSSGAAGTVTALAAVTAAGALGLAGVAAAILVRGRQDGRRSADCIIVLGTSVGPNGVPMRELRARVRHAVQLRRDGVASHIINTGGNGRAGVTESQAAARLETLDGVPSDALLQDNASTSTFENLIAARAIMQSKGWRTAVVSTGPYHARRVRDIASELDLDATVSPAPDGAAIGIRALLRETLATLRYWNYRLGRVAGRGAGTQT